MISTVGKEAITTWPNKGEAMPPLTSLLPRKLLYPRLIMLREWPRKLVTMQSRHKKWKKYRNQGQQQQPLHQAKCNRAHLS